MLPKQALPFSEVLEGVAKINTEIEEVRVNGAAYEEEALRKDGEASVLEATLNQNSSFDEARASISFVTETSSSFF